MLFARSTSNLQLSELLQRIQRLEKEHAQLLARIEGEAALRRAGVEIAAAANEAAIVGLALDGFASAMRHPIARGRVGGLARARQAAVLRERWSNGQYMGHADWEQIEREVSETEYMRYAAGGFARAEAAKRASNGTFLPT
jgi:hypothetical protein